jgi:hypothetical protein
VTTWQFWRTLKNPPHTDPLFCRIMNQPRPRVSRRFIGFGLVLIVAFYGMLLLESNSVQTLQPVLFLASMIIPILLLATMLNSTIYATGWAISIGTTIAQEREQRRYDLLCLLPPGSIAACLTICSGCLNRNQSFRNIPSLRKFPLTKPQIIFGGLLFLLFLYAYALEGSGTEIVSIVIGSGTIIAAFFVDYIQAAVLASLVGILVSTYPVSPIDARLWSALSFLLLQIGSYVVTLFTGLVLLPTLFGVSYILSVLTLPLLTLLFFCGLREGIIIVLLRAVTYRLQSA